MQKIQFNSSSQMWRFLETSKIESYSTDNSLFVAKVYGATDEQIERAKTDFNGKLI